MLSPAYVLGLVWPEVNLYPFGGLAQTLTMAEALRQAPLREWLPLGRLVDSKKRHSHILRQVWLLVASSNSTLMTGS